MCSINGFNFKDEGLVKKMVEVTKHRGPDQEGFYCDENVSLGQARLSIIDLSEKGRQPIWNEDKSICVLCNGEIYNFKELRKELQAKGHRFFSHSDSEVILHLYEEKGERCVEDLNGIFAFVIFDKNKNKLFLARDRVGVKPLYYYFDGKRFIFSSEIKAILCHSVPKEIDQEALFHYFRLFFVPSPFTLFKNIWKLVPAHHLTYKNGEIVVKRYWDIKDLPEIESKEEAIEKIKLLLKDSVRRQLISDRPLGIFLSGGIDSTSILGIASEFTSGKIKTYSVGFDIDIERDKYNRDFQFARQTSKYYNTSHHELLISDIDARDNIEKAIWHMEEPVPNPIQIATFLLAKEAKKEVAVVLGGDGGDELFGGYPRYYYSQLIDRFQLFPSFLRKNFLPYSLLELIFQKKDLKEKLNIPPGASRYLLHMGQKAEILSQVLNKKFDEDLTKDFLKRHYPENKFKDQTKYLMYLDLSTWLPDESLIRSDKMTMAFGLEERVPILDHRLVELAFRIPTRYKVKGKRNNKWIFQEAMKEYLPSHVLGQEKRGWFSPAAKWLRAGLKDFAYEVLSPNYCSETQQYFNFPQIKEILDDHISGKKYNLDIIWSLLTFQIWYKSFLK
ncbi:MAG: asparagine synthase (glutamine-hydrolyzing) [Patescibacteria group bacterium]|nr:asparagine synthase (glutamine-hydrolyzing) [Patescibacteria group bacterium]